MNVKQALEKAKARIENRAHWTTGSFARSATGITVHTRSPQATCFCVAGAVAVVTPSHGLGLDLYGAVMQHLGKVCIDNFGEGITDVNDDLGFEAVHKLLDLAIEKAPS